MNGSHVEDVVPSVVSIGLHLTADLFHAATGKEHVRTIDLIECYSLRMPKVWLLMHIAFGDTCRRNKPYESICQVPWKNPSSPTPPCDQGP